MQVAQNGQRIMPSPSGGMLRKNGQGNSQRLERAKVRAKEKTEKAMAKEKAKDGKGTAAALAKVRAKARMAKETKEKGKAKAMKLDNVIIVGSGGILEKIAQFKIAGKQHPSRRRRLSHQGL